MSGAFKPVKDVSAPGVVDLVEWVSVGLLHGHRIAEKQKQKIRRSRHCTGLFMYYLVRK